MGRKKVNPNGDDIKDLYPLLGKDEKTAIENSSDEELNKRISDVAKNDAALSEAEKQDQDLAEKKAKVKSAREVYVDGHKANKQRIAKCREILSARGKDAGDAGVDKSGSAGGLSKALQKEIKSFVDSAKATVGPGGSITFKGPGDSEGVTIQGEQQ